jgi:transcriptional regulator with GAF, ATPase, and Fis domain/Tfp pilus assembly protein PilF
LRERFALVEAYSGGEGWSGRVQDRAAGRELLLKVLSGGVAPHEASLLASLEHPGIPSILETGVTEDGDAYLLREHLRGTPLSEVLPLDAAEVIELATQLLEVLAYVHLRGVLHLDIKPANVLRASDGDRYMLLDFGLGARGGEHATGGTPFYAAPEQLLGLPADPRSDLFSLGALLFVALGYRRNPRSARQHFLAAAGVDPASLPAPFDALLPRLLATDPSQRFADAQEALEFMTGGSGRPPAALLRPDAIRMFGAALQQCITGLAPGVDLHIVGGDAEDRRLLAIHASAVLEGVSGIDVASDECVLRRGGVGAAAAATATARFELPALSRDDIAHHLHAAVGLDHDRSGRAADALLARGVATTTGLAAALEELAAAGHIAPHGPRWIWPDAMTDRLDTSEAPVVEASPDGLRQAAAAGQVVAALRAYRSRAGAGAAEDRELRAGLAEGLLRAGEPARCLTLAPDLPVHRARARYDMGQPELAERLLDDAPPGDEQQVEQIERLRAAIDYSRGRLDQAEVRLRQLRERFPAPEQRALLGLVLSAKGEYAAAREELESVLARPNKERLPFVYAAALNNLAEVERRVGSSQRAIECYREAMDVLQSLGNVRHTATTCANLGVLAKDAGNFDEATEQLRRARSLFEHLADHTGAAIAQANLGVVSLESGDAHGAKRRLQTARDALTHLGAGESMPLVLLLLARAHALLGDWQAADICVAEAGPPKTPRLEQELQKLRTLRSRSDPAEAEMETQPDPRTSTSQQVATEVFRTFLAINRRLAGEADLERAMTYLLDAAVTLSGGRNGILLVSRADGLRREFSTGEVQSGPGAFSRSLINRALQEQRILTGDEAQADRELQDMPSVRNLERRSAICVPFRCASGTVGAIYVEHPGRPAVFGDTERGHMEILADQAAIAVDRMLREEQLAAELEQSRRDLQVARRALGQAPTRMIGDSDAMAGLRRELDRVAGSDLAVLVLGETGTGKDLVARMIHDHSQRKRGPFVAENCSAIASELMESELFGHKKGAFTGADVDRAGLFELASGGTLFLDEIGDMPLELQAKLLRALQEQRIRRVGDNQTVPVDIRLVTATHKDIKAAARAGTFREDLYFRIAAVELKVPPLRERGADILLLARDFLARFNREQGRRVKLAKASEKQLLAYPWRGNVRELQHVIARAAILADQDTIEQLELPEAADVSPASASALPSAPSAAAWPVISLQEAEARTIQAALAATGGEKTKAARLLGISRTALYEKLKRIERQES